MAEPKRTITVELLTSEERKFVEKVNAAHTVVTDMLPAAFRWGALVAFAGLLTACFVLVVRPQTGGLQFLWSPRGQVLTLVLGAAGFSTVFYRLYFSRRRREASEEFARYLHDPRFDEIAEKLTTIELAVADTAAELDQYRLFSMRRRTRGFAR